MSPGQETDGRYRVTGYFDEAFTAEGKPRPAYRPLRAEIDGAGLAGRQRKVTDRLSADGVEFGPERTLYPIDPVPRLVAAGDWATIETGLRQRVRALQRFLADIYSDREIIEAGVVRDSILDGAPHFEPLASTFPGDVVADLAGPDLVRDREGFRVLEDNLRFPAGLAFALAARRAVEAAWGPDPVGSRVPAGPAVELLARALRARDPRGTGDPSIAVLSEGPESITWFEHRWLAERIGAAVVSADQLEPASSGLRARIEGEPRPVHVLYNRSDTDRLTGPDGEPTPLGELLIGPLKDGRLACVNSFGAGVADDKAVHCYTEEMIRFYLGEEPVLRIPRSFDLGDRRQADEALEQLDRLVIKPRWELGGQDIVIGPEADADELDRVRATLRSDPGGYVAQEMIELSTHPTLAGGGLEPRHVDLRPFVVSTGGKQHVLPVALTRFAKGAGSKVVNSTQGGGAKDTWIARTR